MMSQWCHYSCLGLRQGALDSSGTTLKRIAEKNSDHQFYFVRFFFIQSRFKIHFYYCVFHLEREFAETQFPKWFFVLSACKHVLSAVHFLHSRCPSSIQRLLVRCTQHSSFSQPVGAVDEFTVLLFWRNDTVSISDQPAGLSGLMTKWHTVMAKKSRRNDKSHEKRFVHQDPG